MKKCNFAWALNNFNCSAMRVKKQQKKVCAKMYRNKIKP